MIPMQRPMLCMYRSEDRSYYGGIGLKRDDPSLFRLYLVMIETSQISYIPNFMSINIAKGIDFSFCQPQVLLSQ